MLYGDLATVLSGRYIEIRIHGLSFSAFLIFHKIEDTAENLGKYLKYGGLPNPLVFPLTDQVVFDYLISQRAAISPVIISNYLAYLVLTENNQVVPGS
jgi:uncharacterized protein